MTLKLIAEKLERSEDKFITRDAIKKYCKALGMEYGPTIRYLTSYNHLERILRGIFYIRSLEERKRGKLDISPLEAISKALAIKGVKEWYFGLESALKLENLTHEHIAVETIINDRVFRPRTFTIMGLRVRFVKIHKRLASFGVAEKPVRHSTPEKTVLDMMYLAKYNSMDEESIIKRVSEIMAACSKKAIREHAREYPKTVQRMMEKML